MPEKSPDLKATVLVVLGTDLVKTTAEVLGVRLMNATERTALISTVLKTSGAEQTRFLRDVVIPAFQQSEGQNKFHFSSPRNTHAQRDRLIDCLTRFNANHVVAVLPDLDHLGFDVWADPTLPGFLDFLARASPQRLSSLIHRDTSLELLGPGDNPDAPVTAYAVLMESLLRKARSSEFGLIMNALRPRSWGAEGSTFNAADPVSQSLFLSNLQGCRDAKEWAKETRMKSSLKEIDKFFP